MDHTPNKSQPLLIKISLGTRSPYASMQHLFVKPGRANTYSDADTILKAAKAAIPAGVVGEVMRLRIDALFPDGMSYTGTYPLSAHAQCDLKQHMREQLILAAERGVPQAVEMLRCCDVGQAPATKSLAEIFRNVNIKKRGSK